MGEGQGLLNSQLTLDGVLSMLWDWNAIGNGSAGKTIAGMADEDDGENLLLQVLFINGSTP